ncbi:MAG: MarR family transcriptional regulator [Verrucomicrobiales bacterium]|jgi:DNA-binding MarR family transcriptional regulator|nr:MarR family transcriptional regulator [Verrucomicrobiales bacterium]
MEATNTYAINSPQVQRLAEIAMFLQRNFLVHVTEKVAENKISVPQFTLLGFLSINESLNMGKLASLMGHTTPATTGLVDRLTQAGLVERFTTPTDRRQVLVKITPKGASLVGELKLDISKAIHEIMQALSPEDREAWIRIYNSIYQFCGQKQKKS